MTNAILEILFLLTVSCLIGIFFTYRYWKSKCNHLGIEISKLKSQIESLRNEVSDEKGKAENATARLSEVEKALEASRNAENAALEELEKTRKNLSNKESDAKKKDAQSAGGKDANKLLLAKDHEIEKLTEQMAEKEREIESLHKELEAKKISYYKQIDGKRYKAITIKMADEAVEGQGDGRISKADAEKIFDTISDGKAYTQVEKDTMHYLRENYIWTDEADKLFRTKVRSWAAKHHELD